MSTCTLLPIFLPVTRPFHLPKLLPIPSLSLCLTHYSPLSSHADLFIPVCPLHRETKGSVGGRLKSLSYLDDEDVFEQPVIVPRYRGNPVRSHTVDAPYSSSYEAPEPRHREAAAPAASPPGRPAGSDASTAPGRTSLRTPEPPAAQRSPTFQRSKVVETTSITSSPSSTRRAEPEAPSSASLYKPQPMEPKPPAVSRVSASLPRSYQKPDSSRLTSVYTAKPFGTQPSRLSSLPRTIAVSTR